MRRPKRREAPYDALPHPLLAASGCAPKSGAAVGSTEELVLQMLPPTRSGRENFKKKLRGKVLLLDRPTQIKANARKHQNPILHRQKSRKLVRLREGKRGGQGSQPAVRAWPTFQQCKPLHELWQRHANGAA